MSMADRDGFIWYDGKLVPWRDATTHVLTHSLHYGLSVFEGVRAYNTVNGPAIFRLKEHTERLFTSAHIYMMKMPYSKEEIMEAQCEVVRANKLDSAYIRLPFTAPKRWAFLRRARPCMWPSPLGRGARIWAKKAWKKAYASRRLLTRAIMLM